MRAIENHRKITFRCPGLCDKKRSPEKHQFVRKNTWIRSEGKTLNQAYHGIKKVVPDGLSAKAVLKMPDIIKSGSPLSLTFSVTRHQGDVSIEDFIRNMTCLHKLFLLLLKLCQFLLVRKKHPN